MLATISVVAVGAGALVVTGAGVAGADTVPAPCAGMSAISTRGDHALAIGPGGTVYGWGPNGNGQLGDGTTTDRHSPVQVPGLSGVTSVSAGQSHSLAVGPGGTVFSWGGNSSGQLGDGTTTDRYSPVQVTGLAGVTAVSAGWIHSLAIAAGGTVYAWGGNSAGELGDGTTTAHHTPVLVPGLSGVIAVSAGDQHSIAITAGGTVYTWGYNGNGQLGDGTTTERHTPVPVSGLSGVIAVSAGGFHSLAVDASGTVHAWGANSWGELGDGTSTDRLSPVPVVGLAGATAVAAGYSHSVAVGPGGAVYAWGQNAYGGLGDGTTTDRQSPVQVPGLSGTTAVSAGAFHSLALGAGGAMYAWGHNNVGQVGDGTTTDRLTPVQVVQCVPPVPGVTSGIGNPSDDCATGSALADGFAGSTYVRLRTKQADAQTTWVCVRADGPAINTGGKVVITSPVANVGGLPTTDTNADACSVANNAPPSLAGHLGDPSDPTTYVPYFVDAYNGASATWVCVEVGSFRERVIVPTSVGTTPPTVTFVADISGPHVPSPTAPATPSGSCQTGGGSRITDLTTSGTRAYAYSWQPTPSVVKLCVRVDGAVSAGGVLTLDATGVLGALPTVTTGSDIAGCDLSVAGIDSPVKVEVRRSSGTLPASVCVTVGTTTVRVTASTGSGQPPVPVTWSPDPGTP